MHDRRWTAAKSALPIITSRKVLPDQRDAADSLAAVHLRNYRIRMRQFHRREKGPRKSVRRNLSE